MQPGDPPDLSQLLQQAQQMQQQMARAQEELAATEVTGSAGGGAVTATVLGNGDLLSVVISPDVVDPEDTETLQDLVTAAVRDAQRAVGELAARTLGPVTAGFGSLADRSDGSGGGLGLPGR